MNAPSAAYREHTVIPDPSFPMNVFKLREPDTLIIPPHWHEFAEWMIIRSGSFHVQVDSLSSDLGEGDVVFVAPGRVHAAFPISEGTDILAVVFDETLVRSAALDDAELRCALPLLRGDLGAPFSFGPGEPVSARIASCLGRVEREFGLRPPGFELFVKSALIESLGELFRACISSRDASAASARERGCRPIAALLRRLCLDYMESVSVDEAAAECGLSKGYFCHAFKKATGKTLVEYVRTLRIIEAESLLANTTMTVNEIANCVGFEDPAYFGRVFKRLRGIGPREARRRRQ